MTDKLEKNLKSIRVILTVLLILAILAVSKLSGEVSIQILLSVFIFLLVLPLATALEKAKFPQWLATIVAILVIIVVILFFVWFVFFSVDLLIKKVPTYAARINDLDGLLKSIAGRWIEIPEEASFLSSLNIDWVGGVLMPMLRSVSSSAIGILKNVMIVILMTAFLLMERHTIIPKIINFVTDDKGSDRVSGVWERIVKQVSKYISIKVLVSIITGSLFYVVGLVVGLDFAFIWAVLAVIMNFIPTIGSIVITVLMIVMSIVQFAPDLGPILVVAVSTVMIQNIIGNFIDPKLSGNSLNLSPFVILVSLAVFGYVWGIVGMFLAVPLLSIVQIVCANVDETRPIAMAISSGRTFRRETRERPLRRKPMKASSKTSSKKGPEPFADDIMFPDKR